MDPLSSTATIVSVLVLVNNLYGIAGRLNRSPTSNTRLKTQQIALKIEKKTLEEWLKNCAMSGAPVMANKEIIELLMEFEGQAIGVQKRLEQYTIDDKLTPKTLLARIKYETGGYEELSDMITLLEKVNKALQTIAPPLPPGYDYATNTRTHHRRAADNNPGEGSGRREYTENMSPEHSGSASEGFEPSIDLENQGSYQDIYSLWRACTEALETLSLFARHQGEAFQTCKDRMRLWGTGLFGKGELHLDALLGRSTVMYERMAEPLVSNLVEMMMEQVQLIDTWLQDESIRGHGKLKDVSIKLRTLLLVTDVTQPLLEDMLYRCLDGKPAAAVEASEEDRISSQYLQEMVEVLFTYLPAINTLRKSRVLAVEDIKAAPEESAALVGIEQGKHRLQRKTIELIRANSEATQELEAVLRAQQADKGNRDETLATYASVVSKERQRLEEWRLNKETKLGSTENESEVFKMQENLNSKLQPLLEIFSMTKPVEAFKFPSAKDEKRRTMSEDEIKEAVESLRTTTTHLFEATR